jgi:hypothetical protein
MPVSRNGCYAIPWLVQREGDREYRVSWHQGELPAHRLTKFDGRNVGLHQVVWMELGRELRPRPDGFMVKYSPRLGRSFIYATRVD